MADECDDVIEQARIIETINQLFIGTDKRDWALVKRCFAPTVLFDMSSLGAGPPAQKTPADIVAAWDAGLRPLAAVHHQSGNFIVRVSGKKADAFCYGIALHFLPNASGRNTRMFVGSYDVGLLKDAGSWSITEFKFTLKFLDGNPALESS